MVAHASPGDSIGEYQLDCLLGQGGFGEIWKAHHRAFREQLVAIKLPRGEADREALRREGDLQHRLRHPGIVRCLGMDLEATPPYIVMEYLPGGTLRDKLQAGPLPWQEAAGLTREILTTLRAAHADDVVHLDLKPENVLFDEEGRSKLTDFGLSRSLNDLETSLQFSAENASTVAGTLAYMAPEQRKGEAADASTDLFAVGAMLFEMLTGEPPVGADSLRELVPQAPLGLDAVFRRSFTRRARRYRSAQAMLQALDRATAVPRSLPPPFPAPLPPPRWPTRTTVAVPGPLPPPPPYGQALPARLRAGFTERGLAMLVDALFGVLVLVALVQLPATLVGSGNVLSLEWWGPAYLAYRWLGQGLFGGTPGQRLIGLRVVRYADGGPLGLGLALARALAFCLALVTLFGLPLAGLSAKRGLHDYLAGTCVQRM